MSLKIQDFQLVVQWLFSSKLVVQWFLCRKQFSAKTHYNTYAPSQWLTPTLYPPSWVCFRPCLLLCKEILHQGKRSLCPRRILRKAAQLREKLIQQHPAGRPGASRCLSGPWQPNFQSDQFSSAFSDSFNFFHIIWFLEFTPRTILITVEMEKQWTATFYLKAYSVCLLSFSRISLLDYHWVTVGEQVHQQLLVLQILQDSTKPSIPRIWRHSALAASWQDSDDSTISLAMWLHWHCLPVTDAEQQHVACI